MANYFSRYMLGGNTLALFIPLFKLWTCILLIPGLLSLALSTKLKELYLIVIALLLNRTLTEVGFPRSMEWWNPLQYAARVIDLEAQGVSVYSSSSSWLALGYYSNLIISFLAILLLLGSKLYNRKSKYS